MFFLGTECSVSMDSVLRKQYHGKLEHRVVTLHEVLPPPGRLSAPTVASPQPVESSSATGDQPAPDVSLCPELIPRSSGEALTDDVVDSKDGIIANIHRVAEKGKVAQAISNPVSGGSSLQISRHVVQRRGLMRLLSSMPPHHGDVLVIPNDDVQQSEGVERASHYPIVPAVIASSPCASPRSLRDSVERLHHEFSTMGAFHGGSVFVPRWNLRVDSHFSVRSATLEFTQHALSTATIKDIDMINNVALSHNLAYAMAQAMAYLAAGSRRVQRFDNLERAHSALVTSEASLKGPVMELEVAAHLLDQKNKSLVLEKLLLEDV